MLTTRIIPVLLYQDGFLVKSRGFGQYQRIGDPYQQLERYNEWDLDELIYLDISKTKQPGLLSVLKQIGATCFMPLTFGGNITSLTDIETRLNAGADKITLNTAALSDRRFIEAAAKEFGQQAIIVSIDVFETHPKQYHLYHPTLSSDLTQQDPVSYAKSIQEAGAGEILIQHKQHDGYANGFDNNLIQSIVNHTTIPIIAMSGARHAQDILTVAESAHVSAVAAANLFLFTELSYFNVKKMLEKHQANIRTSNHLSLEVES